MMTLTATLFAAAGASAQQMRPVLDHATAQTMRDHCAAAARDTGARVAISIYDHSGVMIVFDRMDGASAGAVEAAHWKGRSAAIWEFSTAETATWNASAPDLATVEGGVTIFTQDGVALGGIGVSGAASAFDAACASSAIRAAGLFDHRPG